MGAPKVAASSALRQKLMAGGDDILLGVKRRSVSLVVETLRQSRSPHASFHSLSNQSCSFSYRGITHRQLFIE